MLTDILKYNNSIEESELCNELCNLINKNLKNAQAKIWHAHPVWFIDGNPIVGYSKQKKRNQTDVLERKIFSGRKTKC